jgi:uncharacterized protein DUF6398
LPLLICDDATTFATELTVMNLTFDDGNRFYDLYAALLSFVNRKLEVTPEQFSNSREYASTPPVARLAIRDALFAHRELIDEFVRDNPANLKADDLEIVVTWKHAVAGKFYVFRYLKKYTVLLTSGDSPNKAYGVLGLADPLEEVVGRSLPRLVTTVLLPFQGQLIYDGLMSEYNISFGGSIKRTLNDEYKQAKETFGIITSLGDDMGEEAKPPRRSKSRPRKATKTSRGRSAASEAKEVAEALNRMTGAFCRDFLNEEYAELCRELAGALARKRPSPLLRGRLGTWASGIVRTIGWVNFLDDPSQTPHLAFPSIDEAFGIASSTGAAKSKAIRTMLKIVQFDPKWTLPSQMDENPMVWMLEVDGFLMDIRDTPREIQEVAFQKGLIPYIPADRAESREES